MLYCSDVDLAFRFTNRITSRTATASLRWPIFLVTVPKPSSLIYFFVLFGRFAVNVMTNTSWLLIFTTATFTHSILFSAIVRNDKPTRQTARFFIGGNNGHARGLVSAQRVETIAAMMMARALPRPTNGSFGSGLKPLLAKIKKRGAGSGQPLRLPSATGAQVPPLSLGKPWPRPHARDDDSVTRTVYSRIVTAVTESEPWESVKRSDKAAVWVRCVA